MRRALFLLCTTLVGAAPLAADTHPNLERGFAADKAFQVGDVDHVNLFNGNLVITLPVGGSYPVGGTLSYGLNVVFNSNPWNFVEREAPGITYQQAVANSRANAGFGWTLSLGRLESPATAPNTTGRWLYIAPDGSEHPFFDTLHEAEDEPATIGVWYTRDSTYMRLKDVTGGFYEIEMPNGEIHRFMAGSEVLQIRDRFGNSIDVTQYAPYTEIRDSLGRVQRVNFTGVGASRRISSVVLTAFGGTTAAYTFGYALTNVSYPCPHNDPQLPGPLGVYLLSSITQPDGSTFSVPEYYVNQSAGCKTPGSVKSLVLPTLGKIGYSYQDYVFPVDAKISRQRSNGVATRTLYNAAGAQLGQWQYATLLNGAELKNTVTTPLSHATEHFFSVASDPIGATWNLHEYGLPLTRNAADATGTRFLSRREYGTGGVLLRSSYVRYERDAGTFSDATEATKLNQRLASTRTAYEDDAVAGSPQGGKRFADDNASDFDGLGHYRTTQTAGNFAAADQRTWYTRYNSARGTYPGSFSMWPINTPWILNTFDLAEANTPSAIGRRTFLVDFTTGWVSLTRTHASSTGAEGSNDVIVESIRDAGGNLQSERHYGGDTQAVGTGPLPTLVLPQPPQYRIDYTTQYGSRATATYVDAAGNALSFKSLDQTIDFSTGLPSSSRDSSNISTSYEYDAMGRLRFVKPQTSHDGWTEYGYTRATSSGSLAQVNVYRRPNGGGTPLAESLVKYDAFGRVWQEQQKMPNGTWSTRETLYDAMGWKSSVSEQGNTAKKTQYLGYDRYGRPATVRPSDGSGHDVSFVYTGVRSVARSVKVADRRNPSTGQVEEWPAWTTEVYNRQGLLYQVKEEAEPNFTNTTTTYTYDGGKRLAIVNQATSAGTQSRYFNYDQRGFLLSEQHPEKGASGNGLVYYTSYDARGHAGRRYECSGAACTDRTADLSFAYDRAERLTTVTDVTVPSTPKTLKTFAYGTSNAVGIRSNGKLETATRYNYVSSPFNTTVQVAETYTYGGRQGRVSKKDTFMTFSGGSETFTQSYLYDQLGNVAHIDYPVPTHGVPTVPRGVDFTYTNGMLTAVPGFATSITYHPNGLYNQVTHANSVVDTQTNDPNGMRRPAAITASRLGNTIWTSGTYAYDGAGNIKGVDNGYFLYDHVSRLVDGRIDDNPVGAGTLRYQTYTYDPFGNLTNITGDPWAAGRSTPTSAATNRLTTATYDVPGRMTSWNGNSYEYDALGMMIRMVAGGEDWRYLYTADDERFWSQRTAGGGNRRYLRDLDGKVLREFEIHVSWTSVRDYVYRNGQLLASNYPGEGDRHFSLDHLGTPQAITDSAGVAKIHLYLPYGEELSSPTLDAERMKFTGHERDFASLAGVADDLDYMHARHYNPLIGRLLSTDPVGGKPGLPQSWNLYVYALNNPVKYVDPNGEAAIDANVRGFLEAWFGANLSGIDLQTGPMAWNVASLARGASAVTVGNMIFLSAHSTTDYRLRNFEGLATLGHEIAHYLQYEREGVFSFLSKYLDQGFRGQIEQGESYLSISYERSAYATEANMREFLRTPEGGAIVANLSAGGSVSEADKKAIDQFLINKASDGQLKAGFQFVNGQLVYVRM